MSFVIHFNSAGVTDVTLRDPDWNNVIRVDNNDIRRLTRGKVFKSFADEDWAEIVIYKYSFSQIRRDTIYGGLKLRVALKNCAGRHLTWTDHLDVTRSGVIVSPINEIIAERPDCSYSVTLEFMEDPT